MLSWVGLPNFTGCPAYLLLSVTGPAAGEVPLTPTEEASLPLAVTKEAKDSTLSEELQEDQLGEDELASLETP